MADSAALDTRLCVHLATGLQKNLSKRQWRLATALRERIEAEGLRVREGAVSDRLAERFERMEQYQGCLTVAFSQWKAQRVFRDPERSIVVCNEFVHIANALAVSAHKPLLVIREKNVAERGSLRRGYLHPVIDMPIDPDEGWLEGDSFQQPFREWISSVKRRKHVFLGYSAKSIRTARALKSFLVEKLGLSVLDWHEFEPSGTVMQNIEEAERLCRWGLFLFMADDMLDGADGQQAVPRDNVIYEAGYFAGAKHQSSTIVVRERTAKVPTDLSGMIYLELKSRSDIAAIEPRLARYFSSKLPAGPETDIDAP